MSTNAIIYARVSSKEQETGGYSIPAQIDFLTNYAKQKSFNIIKTFTESVSAKDKNCRVEYDNMIAFAKKTKRRLSHPRRKNRPTTSKRV